eukprot:TRINITY_DN10027_c0_g2_i1.p1 TRINITY_DN10027_c0_g2~~TRINITY_DN10027_c0_g2_i1.p1  ORF type:complete len:208 (+),score=29.78 TRINITY_DN10027_c0_g2_i1:739-1362(+)
MHPFRGQNTFSLAQLLQMSDPKISFSDIRTEGAILSVVVIWECDREDYNAAVVDECQPKFKVRPMIENGEYVGYSASKFMYYKGPGGVDFRDVYNMTGVRIMAQTMGRKVNIIWGNILLIAPLLYVLLYMLRGIFDLFLILFSDQEFRETKLVDPFYIAKLNKDLFSIMGERFKERRGFTPHDDNAPLLGSGAVSYTHLTLPTIYSV